MAKVVVKDQKERFEWIQSEDSVTIQVPISGVSIKNINVFYSDYFVKINVKEIKFILAIDLDRPIDFKSK